MTKYNFKVGRDGDHTLIPFECDTCIFRKLKRRNPEEDTAEDRLLLGCIRRVNSDAMWIRSTLTVKGNASWLKVGLDISNSVRLLGLHKHTGTLPHYDHYVYETAIQIVLFSRKSEDTPVAKYVSYASNKPIHQDHV